MTIDAIDVEATESPDRADAAAVLAGWRTFNSRFLGPHRHRPPGVFARRRGTLIGGLIGASARGWLLVGPLWVAETERGRRLGSSLLRIAETEALAPGCDHARLETLDFQARPFYERHGYAVVAELDGFANGHRSFILRKQLGS
jgi:GNAT superfamily N-acetyltransferase